MIVLEFILLIVGLIISVVTMIKTDIEKNPRLKKDTRWFISISVCYFCNCPFNQ